MAVCHSEKEAKRLIIYIVSAEIFDVLNQQQSFNLTGFVKGLVNLPAMPWHEEEC
jgi:hypothetical protein